MATKTLWAPVPPCPHPVVWMANTHECAICWMLRMATADEATCTATETEA
jgi:hypothetical protein